MSLKRYLNMHIECEQKIFRTEESIEIKLAVATLSFDALALYCVSFSRTQLDFNLFFFFFFFVLVFFSSSSINSAGPFTFTYNRGHGECKNPVSNIESCTEDSKLLLNLQACPDVAGTESTGLSIIVLVSLFIFVACLYSPFNVHYIYPFKCVQCLKKNGRTK